MAPRNTNRGPSVPSSGDAATPLDESTTTESLADARQEIDRLTDLLRATQEQLEQAQHPTDPTPAPDQNFTTLVETLVRALGRASDSPKPAKSTKVPDPPELTDGKNPTFTSWKKLM